MTEQDSIIEEDKKEEKEEKAKIEPSKRMTQALKDRCIHLKYEGLNTKAIAETVGMSEAKVDAAIKVDK